MIYSSLHWSQDGYKAITISTIVDPNFQRQHQLNGYKAITISTIVDWVPARQLLCGYKAITISTIVDKQI